MSDHAGQPDRLIIFDTTLRDGEQSPGASMNLAEKLEVAQALADLGVDVVEAGFPIASPGDFEAVQAIARQVHGPVICGLARCNPEDIDRAWEALLRDKKAVDGDPRLVLLEAPGRPVTGVELPAEDVRAALESLIA